MESKRRNRRRSIRRDARRSIKRLDARPIATLLIEAQERRERFDRFYRDE
jgi:hypothetical protein